MKRIAILLAISFGSISSAQAQRASIYDVLPDQWKDIKLGPFVSVGECLNTGNVAVGISTSPGFSFSAGAIADLPLTQSISFTLALGYDARSVNFQQFNNSATQVNYSFNYLAIRPEFLFNGFLIGVGIGLPLSSSASGAGTPTSPTNFGTSSLNTLFEIRLGGVFPITQWATGGINFTIEGAYAFTQIVSSELTPNGATTTTAIAVNNGPLATGEIGIQYVFDFAPR